MELKNTFVLRTDDNNFKKALDQFLIHHCNEKDVNAAVYELSESGASDVVKIIKNLGGKTMRQEVENPIISHIHEPVEIGMDWRGNKVEPGTQYFHDLDNDEIVHPHDLEDYAMEKLSFTIVTQK